MIAERAGRARALAPHRPVPLPGVGETGLVRAEPATEEDQPIASAVVRDQPEVAPLWSAALDELPARTVPRPDLLRRTRRSGSVDEQQLTEPVVPHQLAAAPRA